MHFKHHLFFFLKCGKCPGPDPPPKMWNFPHFYYFFLTGSLTQEHNAILTSDDHKLLSANPHPCSQLRDNALHPRLAACVTLLEEEGGDQEEAATVPELETGNKEPGTKWGWMKEDDRSVGSTKYRLSIFW